MSEKFVRIMATFFYIGNFPVAPGSMASLAGALIAISLHQNVFLYILVTIAATLIGFVVSGPMEELANEKDPSCVVIDEVAGIMIAFFLLPISVPIVIVTFFLFRAFDMFKIYPVNKFEEIEGGAGIMMDDVFAGFYTNVIMHIAIRLVGMV